MAGKFKERMQERAKQRASVREQKAWKKEQAKFLKGYERRLKVIAKAVKANPSAEKTSHLVTRLSEQAGAMMRKLMNSESAHPHTKSGNMEIFQAVVAKMEKINEKYLPADKENYKNNTTRSDVKENIIRRAKEPIAIEPLKTQSPSQNTANDISPLSEGVLPPLRGEPSARPLMDPDYRPPDLSAHAAEIEQKQLAEEEKHNQNSESTEAQGEEEAKPEILNQEEETKPVYPDSIDERDVSEILQLQNKVEAIENKISIVDDKISDEVMKEMMGISSTSLATLNEDKSILNEEKSILIDSIAKLGATPDQARIMNNIDEKDNAERLVEMAANRANQMVNGHLLDSNHKRQLPADNEIILDSKFLNKIVRAHQGQLQANKAEIKQIQQQIKKQGYSDQQEFRIGELKEKNSQIQYGIKHFESDLLVAETGVDEDKVFKAKIQVKRWAAEKNEPEPLGGLAVDPDAGVPELNDGVKDNQPDAVKVKASKEPKADSQTESLQNPQTKSDSNTTQSPPDWIKKGMEKTTNLKAEDELKESKQDSEQEAGNRKTFGK